jgi:hypothetical protein
MRNMLFRGRMWLLTTAAGGLFVLSGCDPDVRDTVLGGVETAVTTLITTFVQAFFETVLKPDDGAATVKAFVEQLPNYFA